LHAALELPLLPDRPVASLTALARFTAQACEACAHLHEHRVVHGDVKRDNLRWDGAAVTLLDLDCAVELEGRSKEELPRHFGTSGWWAPEVARGSAPADPAADVWSLGIVLAYEALRILHSENQAQMVLEQDLPGGLAYLEDRLGSSDSLCMMLRATLQQEPALRPSMCQLLAHQPFLRPCEPRCVDATHQNLARSAAEPMLALHGAPSHDGPEIGPAGEYAAALAGRTSPRAAGLETAVPTPQRPPRLQPAATSTARDPKKPKGPRAPLADISSASLNKVQ
jgi:serine/threonine protein kinase